VVITEHNHPSNNDSWKVRGRRDGIVVKSVAVPVPGQSAADLLEGLERAMTARTRVVAITHLTSTCGLLYPARDVAEIARRRNAWYHLDGAQTFGAMDVRLDRIGCDSYATSMHKWPMGPLESGLLFVKAGRQKELWPSIVTAGWSESLPGARKFEVFGQRDNPRLAALDAVADFLAMVGLANIEARVKELTGQLKTAFREMPSLELKTSLDAKLSHGVVKVFPKRGDVTTLYDRLWSEHRVSIAMTAAGDSAGLRFSPHIYNTDGDIARAVEAVRKVLA
jgi:selenocysteine lyase/cysteine desulfurase